MSIRDNIISTLEELGWTQKDLADKVGMPKSSLNNYLKNNIQIPLPVIKKLAEALNVNPLLWIASELGISINNMPQNKGDATINSIVSMLQDMPAEERRKVFEYTEDQKLASEMRKRKAG